MASKTVPEIVDLASAFYGSAVLFAALDLGVFKAIADQGGSAGRDALADALGASARAPAGRHLRGIRPKLHRLPRRGA